MSHNANNVKKIDILKKNQYSSKDDSWTNNKYNKSRGLEDEKIASIKSSKTNRKKMRKNKTN